MSMVIDLDDQNKYSEKQFEKQLFINQLIFTFTPDHQLQQKIHRMDTYIPYLSKNPIINTHIKLKQPSNYKEVYETAAVGGTFDHLHLGHQILLLYLALSASKKVYIGITGDSLLVNKKSKALLQPWSIRKNQVQKFIKSIKQNLQIIIFQLNDIYGVTIQIQNLNILVVSQQTFSAGASINNARLNKNMKQLKIITCPTISPKKDIENKLSSSLIRQYLLNKNIFTMEKYLQYRNYYDRLISRLEINNKQKIELWWRIIFLQYSQYWRFYHTNQHIFRLLENWNSKQFIQKKKKLNAIEINSIQITIFFHDVIYRPNSQTNQQQSAKLAENFILDTLQGGNKVEQLLKEVKKLILQTKSHTLTSNLSQIIYDLDMGILDSQMKQYKQYARNIKKQYYPLFGESYFQKRANLLKKWKQSKLLYSYQAQNWKSNLDWEIYCLQNYDI